MITTGITFALNTTEIERSSNSMVARYLKNNPLGIGFQLNENRKSEGDYFGNAPFTSETIYKITPHRTSFQDGINKNFKK